MAGRFFLFPHSWATLTESTILKMPLSRSTQWMQPEWRWGSFKSSFTNCHRWMLDVEDLLGVGGVCGIGEVDGRVTFGKATSVSDPSSSSVGKRTIFCQINSFASSSFDWAAVKMQKDPVILELIYEVNVPSSSTKKSSGLCFTSGVPG